MPVLTVTKLYQDGNILTEAMLDAIKSSLETFFNTTKIDSSNIQTGGVSTGNLADHAVTNPKIRQAAATSVIGNATSSTADVADIPATVDGTVLKREGGALLFDSVSGADLADNSVPYAKIQQVSAKSVLGNPTNATANVSEITSIADGQVLKSKAGTLMFLQIETPDIEDGVVTPSKLGTVNSVIGPTISLNYNAAGFSTPQGTTGPLTVQGTGRQRRVTFWNPASHYFNMNCTYHTMTSLKIRTQDMTGIVRWEKSVNGGGFSTLADVYFGAGNREFNTSGTETGMANDNWPFSATAFIDTDVHAAGTVLQYQCRVAITNPGSSGIDFTIVQTFNMTAQILVTEL